VKIALIHNPDAFLGEVDGYELRTLFERAGHDVVYVNTNEPDWQRAIPHRIARAIIVGGDGTVQLVAPPASPLVIELQTAALKYALTPRKRGP
jgi:diacylglycerol kinase family enzyme